MDTNEKQFTVITIDVNDEFKTHSVKGTDDEPNFEDLRKLLDCDYIGMLCGRLNGKTYQLYVDDEGKCKKNFFNHTASAMFLDWLEYENRTAMSNKLVGTVAILLDEEDVSQQDVIVDELKKLWCNIFFKKLYYII